MKKLIGFFALIFILGCQKADLIENTDKDTRSDNEQQDSTKTEVDINVEPTGWGAPINVGFGFG